MGSRNQRSDESPLHPATGNPMFLPHESREFHSLGHEVTAAVPDPRPSVLARIAGTYRAWRNRRAVIGLLGFDDRMLRDIGLTRSDVTSALSGPRLADPSIRLASFSAERRDGRRLGVRDTLWSLHQERSRRDRQTGRHAGA